jgi:ketosteroid isomerase-like protein
MNEQENTKVVQQAYDYFKSGNIEGVLSLMSNDVDWRLPKVENMPHAGTRKGIEQVSEFFSILDEVQDAKQFDPNEFIAQGDRVVAMGHYIWKVKPTNREYESDFVHVFTVRDGKITGFDEYFDTTPATVAYQKAQTA